MKFSYIPTIKDRILLRKIIGVAVPLIIALGLVWYTFRYYYKPTMRTKWFAIGMFVSITLLIALSAVLLYKLWKWSWTENSNLNRLYLNDIIKTQEEVRAGLAREIHDGPLQEVTALIQRLRLISLANSQEEALQRLKEAESVSMAAVHELREVCNNLTPPWLELGLHQSLIELAERRSRLYGINIHTTELEDVELNEEQIISFFRVAQQALSNAAQHAEAQNIRIRLINDTDVVRMEIEDDGKGFDVPDNLKKVRTTGHRGLSNMYERMRLIGGSCEIISAPGCGTNVICEVSR